MTGKKRFGNFVVQGGEVVPERGEETVVPEPATSPLAPPLAPPPSAIPTALPREERRPFSTWVKPSLKGKLDTYVLGLKQAGWWVSQEAVLEELLLALEEDVELRTRITSRLTRV